MGTCTRSMAACGRGGRGRLAARVLRLVAMDAGGKRRIGHGDGLGVLVGSVVLLRMDLFVLLEVLGTLERLLANLADVRLQWRMHWRAVSSSSGGYTKKLSTSEMGGNMVPLSAGRAAVLPVAGEAEVARGLAANVVVAEVVVESLGVVK